MDSKQTLFRCLWIVEISFTEITSCTYRKSKLFFYFSYSTIKTSFLKILVLDTDMLCLSDIGEIWSFWRYFNSSQALGLVENQSDWYLGKLWKGQQPWPALGRGFNSGLILMDLV